MDLIIEHGINSLKRAYSAQKRVIERTSLGSLVFGRHYKERKFFWKSEDAVIDYLKHEEFPCKIIIPNVKIINLGNEYRVVVIGIGDNRMGNKNKKLSTLLTIAPNKEDIVFAGFSEYATRRIVYSVKEIGLWEIQYEKELEQQVTLTSSSRDCNSKDVVAKVLYSLVENK